MSEPKLVVPPVPPAVGVEVPAVPAVPIVTVVVVSPDAIQIFPYAPAFPAPEIAICVELVAGLPPLPPPGAITSTIALVAPAVGVYVPLAVNTLTFNRRPGCDGIVDHPGAVVDPVDVTT